MRRLLLLAPLLAAAVMQPAGAAVQNVSVQNNFFSPQKLVAAAGDTVVWTWSSGGRTHNVRSLPDSTSVFSSDDQDSGTFSATFGGGTVFYRCTRHSDLTGADCSGMCGVLDDGVGPAAPAIREPADQATLSSPSVRLRGTADAEAVTVRLREGTRLLADVPVVARSWASTLSFAAGAHTVTATALDAVHNEGAPSQVRFTVTNAEAPPAPVITTPKDGAVFAASTITVAGTATGGTEVVVRDGASSVGRGAIASGAWSVELALEEGLYTLTAVAVAVDQGNIESPPSNAISITIDLTPPEVTVGAPQHLSVVRSPVTITGGASDNVEVASVSVRVQNVATGSSREDAAVCTGCGSQTATWRLERPLSPGLYRIEAVGVDGAGNTATSPATTILAL